MVQDVVTLCLAIELLRIQSGILVRIHDFIWHPNERGCRQTIKISLNSAAPKIHLVFKINIKYTYLLISECFGDIQRIHTSWFDGWIFSIFIFSLTASYRIDRRLNNNVFMNGCYLARLLAGHQSKRNVMSCMRHTTMTTAKFIAISIK